MDFATWLNEVFKRPDDAPTWYPPGRPVDAEEERRRIAFTTKIFQAPSDYLPSDYTPEQLNRGFWWLGGGTGFLVNTMLDPRISLDERLVCVSASATLFSCFFPRHDYLDVAAFMWWEGLVWRIEDGLDRETDTISETTENLLILEATVIKLLEKILGMKPDICHTSALHGIGHLSDALVRKDLIEPFLNRNPDLPEKTRDYARDCIVGDIQ